ERAEARPCEIACDPEQNLDETLECAERQRALRGGRDSRACRKKQDAGAICTCRLRPISETMRDLRRKRARHSTGTPRTSGQSGSLCCMIQVSRIAAS